MRSWRFLRNSLNSTEGVPDTLISSRSESVTGAESTRAATGESIALVMDACWTIGTVEIHPVFPQSSESDWRDFGQQGWADAASPGAIAAQAKEADSSTNISSRTGMPVSALATVCAMFRIAK